jgi:hypothetical protein
MSLKKDLVPTTQSGALLLSHQRLNQSDVTLITYALSQTSRAAIKLSERPSPLLSKDELFILDNQCTRIRRLLDCFKKLQTSTFAQPRVPLGLDAIPLQCTGDGLNQTGVDLLPSQCPGDGSNQTELVFDSTDCDSQPFERFHFVASSGSCEILAGAPVPRSNLVLLDINATSPTFLGPRSLSAAALSRDTSPRALASNIDALRHISDEMRSKGDNIASIKIVALIQHAFTAAFPIPRARLDRGCPWSFTHSSQADQLKLLQNLFAIAKTYLDASLRLLPSHFCSDHVADSDLASDYNQSIDDLDGARSITFACILAVFDAVVSSGTGRGRYFFLKFEAFSVRN